MDECVAEGGSYQTHVLSLCLWIIKINQNPSSIHDIMRAHSTSCCSGLWWSKNILFKMDCAHTWDCLYNNSTALSLYLCKCACTVQLFSNWGFSLNVCWQKYPDISTPNPLHNTRHQNVKNAIALATLGAYHIFFYLHMSSSKHYYFDLCSHLAKAPSSSHFSSLSSTWM